MRTAGRIAESRILTKNRLSGQNARTACSFCCLLRRKQESRRHFQIVFARVVRENLMHLRGEIRCERCRLQASRWCRSGRSLPPAQRTAAAKSSPAGKSVSLWVPPRWVVRGKGLSCKEYTICDMDASTHFFISEALFGDWGGRIRCESKRKAPILSNRC